MEPPSEKKRKQEITEDIVPTPTKKTKLTQAEEDDFKLFVQLPEEIQQYIVFQNAPTFEQAIKNIQGMMQTNRKWQDNINNNVGYIISLLAKRFQVSELLAAFFLGTTAAQHLIDVRIENNKNNIDLLLGYALKETIQRYDNSIRLQKILKSILAKGARFKPTVVLEKDGSFLYATDKFIKKINSDGTDDTKFSLSLPGNIGFVSQLIKALDGSLYIVAQTLDQNSMLIKYALSGTLDKEFGIDGVLQIQKDRINSIAIFPDKTGNILVAGQNKFNNTAILAIYTQKGQLLKEISNFLPNAKFTTIHLSLTNSIFALGYRQRDDIFPENVILQEFTVDLRPKQRTYEALDSNEVKTSLVYQQPNGTIIIAGSYYTPDEAHEYRLFIMRFDEKLKNLINLNNVQEQK